MQHLSDDHKILGIIYCGRNDDYAKNWIKRFEYIFNYNLHVLNELGLSNEVEFHIVIVCAIRKLLMTEDNK